MRLSRHSLFALASVFAVLFCLGAPSSAFAEKSPDPEVATAEPSVSSTQSNGQPSVLAPDVVKAALGDKEEIKKIDQKTTEAKEGIKKQLETVQVVKKEAEKVVEEKKIQEQDTQLKEKAAEIAKQELEIVKKELAAVGGIEGVAKVRELTRESSELDKQAQLSKERLTLLEEKERLTQESLKKSSITIETLNKELLDLKKERNRNLGWVPRLSVGGAIIVVGLLLMFLLNWGLRKFEHAISDKDAIREKETTLRLKTLSSLFRWTGSIVIVGVIIYMLLDNSGVDMAPLLAGAGILGLAVGFGGQYLIRDIINGIFILVEGQYRINDVIKVGELGGLVEAVNLRYTRLRDLEGRVIYIPNGKVETVINFTQEFAQALLSIGVAYKENVDQVMVVLSEIGAEMRKHKYYGRLIKDNLEMLGVDEFADSQVTIKCRIKTLPIKQWEVAREFRRRVKNRFDELDIEIPFPHRTVYQGKEKDVERLREWQKEHEAKAPPQTKRGQAGEAE